jgi:hypothetical protein
MLNELALSVESLPSTWYSETRPCDATTNEAKERYIADMLWWDISRDPRFMRVPISHNPPKPDILWRFYTSVNSWTSEHKCCTHGIIVPALNKLQCEIIRRFNGQIASLRVCVTPCRHRCQETFATVMLVSLSSLQPSSRIILRDYQ